MDRPRQASDRWATPRPLSRRTLVLSIGLHIALLVPPAILLSSQPPRREIGPIGIQLAEPMPEPSLPLPQDLPPVEIEATAMFENLPDSPMPEAPALEAPARTLQPLLVSAPRQNCELHDNPRLVKAAPPATKPMLVEEAPPLPRAASQVVADAPPAAKVLVPVAGLNPSPTYPPSARHQHIEGVVLIRLDVDAAGDVIHCEVSRSSGSRLLDEAALTAARRWHFVGGPGQIEIPFRFELLAAR